MIQCVTMRLVMQPQSHRLLRVTEAGKDEALIRCTEEPAGERAGIGDGGGTVIR